MVGDITLTSQYYRLYADLKRWVFNDLLNSNSARAFMMWPGREFHSIGAQYKNPLEPNDARMRGMIKSLDVDDRKFLLGL